MRKDTFSQKQLTRTQLYSYFLKPILTTHFIDIIASLLRVIKLDVLTAVFFTTQCPERTQGNIESTAYYALLLHRCIAARPPQFNEGRKYQLTVQKGTLPTVDRTDVRRVRNVTVIP